MAEMLYARLTRQPVPEIWSTGATEHGGGITDGTIDRPLLGTRTPLTNVQNEAQV